MRCLGKSYVTFPLAMGYVRKKRIEESKIGVVFWILWYELRPSVGESYSKWRKE